MKPSAFVPSHVEALENRIAMSHVNVVHDFAAARAAVMQSHNVALFGFAVGSDTTVGRDHLLRATGANISPLGKVSLAGFLAIPNGPGAKRAVHGTVSLSSAKGSVIISLRGSVTLFQGPFNLASGELNYKIVRGTGALRGASGTGMVLYGPGPIPIPGRFMLDFGNAPPPP